MMKFQIHCDCNSIFHVDFERIQDKHHLTCSNCDKEYTQELLDKLKKVASSINECSYNSSGTDNVSIEINGNFITR